jgi:pilus assembly protein TadC
VVWRLSAGMEPPAVRARREALTAATPLVVDLLAATLAAGTAPVAAVERIATALDEPMRGELLRLAAGLRYGADPVTAWRRLAADPHLGPVGRSVSRAVDSGASVADAMHRLAEDLRREGRADVEARARAVGVRAAVPLGVCMLPAFVLLGVVPLVAGFLPVVLGR